VQPGRIRHTVAFRLRLAAGSPDEAAFLAEAEALAAIPGVEAFELLRQVGEKNNFDFGISMEFADRSAYDGYNRHELHLRFVADMWVPKVADFLELDYAPIE
jgi:Stress responsive A/B Barrel Domain